MIAVTLRVPELRRDAQLIQGRRDAMGLDGSQLFGARERARTASG